MKIFKKNTNWLPLLIMLVCSAFIIAQREKNTLFIIGDSTVRNGSGNGGGGQWGWGSFIAGYVDTTKLKVENLAVGGRSSRTFITEGKWDAIEKRLKKGDYVLMQFGHNDGGPLDDTARARGSIRGIGTDSQYIYNPITKKNEMVYSYGQYIRRYIREAKQKGATAIVCSPIPRDEWKDGKVVRSPNSYSGWARQVAKEEGAYFIDLNELVAARYEELGRDKVHTFFPGDHTHTNKDGAEINAAIVVAQLKKINPGGIKRRLSK